MRSQVGEQGRAVVQLDPSEAHYWFLDSQTSSLSSAHSTHSSHVCRHQASWVDNPSIEEKRGKMRLLGPKYSGFFIAKTMKIQPKSGCFLIILSFLALSPKTYPWKMVYLAILITLISWKNISPCQATHTLTWGRCEAAQTVSSDFKSCQNTNPHHQPSPAGTERGPQDGIIQLYILWQ